MSQIQRKAKIFQRLNVSISLYFGSVPFSLSPANINSFKNRQYPTCKCRILSRVLMFTSILPSLLSLATEFKLKIFKTSPLPFFRIIFPFPHHISFLQKKNVRHFIDYLELVVLRIQRNCFTCCFFCKIGRNGSPLETSKQRNNSRRRKISIL